MLRIVREQSAEIRDRLIAALELAVAPGAPVERVGHEGRGRRVVEDLVVDIARLGIPVHAEEGLRLPEARFSGPARHGREALRLPERFEGRLKGLLGETGLAEQQGGIGNAPVRRVALDQPLEHATRQRVEPVLERLLAHRPQAVRLIQRDGSRRPAKEGADTAAQAEQEHGAQDPTSPHTRDFTLTRNLAGSSNLEIGLDRRHLVS